MTTYNFSQISDFEFEELCRDLLQAELGLPLELFARGRDRGIDIRYIGVVDGEQRPIVVQCKRWAEDSFPKLLRHLVRVELPKIQELAPARYVVMTSVPLSPDRKDKIVAAMQPWIHTAADVFGRDDLSSLLARHNDVERRHIKLWLTSTQVLDTLLNSVIATRGEGAAERAQRQLRLWVPNPSFERAHGILEANRVCVISGAPGIGKTMLADVLLAGYTSLGYEPIVISTDIEEGEGSWRPSRRQVFHYDDFLGHVTYGELHLRKNEESRLAAFIERVRNSTDKRFILTTREYILSEALSRYERLSDIEVETYKSIVSLHDYTHLIRARILYNHLFFSDLPPKLKRALVPGNRYWDVIRHRNYNPRIIDHAVNLPGVAKLNPEGFVSNMIATLDNPTSVWRRIFDNLPAMACRILLAVASLPFRILLADVQVAVRSLSPGDFDPSEFRSAIGMVEGTFLELEEVNPGGPTHERIVTIRDPSVRDYLWSRLEGVDGEADSLLKSATFFEQCVVLYEGRHSASSSSGGPLSRVTGDARNRVVVGHEAIAEKALELIASPSPRLMHVGDYFVLETPSLTSRATFLATVLVENQTSRMVAASAATALEASREAWEAGRGSSGEGVDLLRQAKRVEKLLPGDVLQRAERAFLGLVSGRFEQTEDFTALVNLADLSADLFVPPHRSLESWGSEFRVFLGDKRSWLLEDSDDPDQLEDELHAIYHVANALETDISELVAGVDEHITELREAAAYEPSYDDWRDPQSEPAGVSAVREVDALLQSLL